MSKFFIDSESISNLSLVLKYYSNKLADVRGTPFTIQTQFQLYLQFGFNLSDIKNRLRAASNDISELCRNLDFLSQGLEFVADESIASENKVWASFTNIPKSVLSGEKIIGNYNITAEFIKNSNNGAHAFAIAWNGDWVENLKGVIGGIGSKITGQDMEMWDTLPEKMVRDSLTQYISELLKEDHLFNQYMDDWNNALNSKAYGDCMKYIKTAMKAGETISEATIADICRNADGVSDGELLLKIMTQKHNLDFIKELSDKLDNTLGVWDDATKSIEVSTELLQKVFTDYTKDIFILETIRQALLDGGYSNETVNSVVDQMLWEYRNQYMSAAIDGIEKLADMGIDEVIKLAGGSTLESFIAVKDIGSIVSGLDDQADALSTIYATQQYSSALVDKYEQYAEKIRSGNYTEDDVNQCALYLKMATTAKIQEYNAMIELYEDAIDGVNEWFVSDEKKDSVNTHIQQLRDEVSRLQNMM